MNGPIRVLPGFLCFTYRRLSGVIPGAATLTALWRKPTSESKAERRDGENMLVVS
jgi:hypothetical protein